MKLVKKECRLSEFPTEGVFESQNSTISDNSCLKKTSNLLEGTLSYKKVIYIYIYIIYKREEHDGLYNITQ